MPEPSREATELRNQLASDKRRLAFLFGAGTSQSAGLPGLAQLSTLVEKDLTGEERKDFSRLLAEDPRGNLETVLNKVRLCREMLGESSDRLVEGLSGTTATGLDRAICRAIKARVSVPAPKSLRVHYVFALWLKTISRAFPIEIFTTNYDLLLEAAMESAETAFFDGFIGSVAPFFRATSIDGDFGGIPIPTVPKDWVRLWKLHGSVSWVLAEDEFTHTKRIVRKGGSDAAPGDELMVYPSRQKYADSRRLPFMAYQDRLRRLLSSGETLLVTCGYSFGDEHLNEIVFQALRSNPRLAVTVLAFEKLSTEHHQKNLLKTSDGITNLSIYGPDAAVVNGQYGEWLAPPRTSSKSDPPFWNSEKSEFTLGDFAAFVAFLRTFLSPRNLASLPAEEGPDAG